MDACVRPSAKRRRELASSANSETWARMPANHERLEGLSRGTLYQLIGKGLVRSVSLRAPGAERGIRLIGLCSLRAYLERLASEQNAPRKCKEAAHSDNCVSP